MTPGRLSERADDLVELMDDPACDPQRLARTYRRFGVVNRMISGWGSLYRRYLRPYLASLDRPARVLDLGCGGGDVLTRLATLARRDHLEVTWTGADPDPRALHVARRRATAGIEFRSVDSAALRVAGETFDAVVSNHVIHHLDASGLAAFADDTRALSTGVVLHSDISRGRLAYGLFAVGITPLAPGTFLRTDGLRSIRRSYRPAELAALLGAGWRVEGLAPFRLFALAEGAARD
nr:methyltransferase domain-containing protein [Propionicimonas sp.]